MEEKVTVLIPFYNPGKYLLDALDSILNQTYNDWKIVLVDDASTDNTSSMIKHYLKNSKIELIQNPVNIGQSKSLNKGLELVDTPYVIQLDSDDWFYPHTLEILIMESQNQPEDVAVIGNVTVHFENSQGKSIVYRGRSFHDQYDFLLANISLWPRFFRTSALINIGGWPTDDPYEGRFLGDKRILLRLIEKYRFHWVDKMIYNHRIHDRNLSNNIAIHAEMTEWVIQEALNRWGNQYKPVFTTYGLGWKKLERLIPINYNAGVKTRSIKENKIDFSTSEKIQEEKNQQLITNKYNKYTNINEYTSSHVIPETGSGSGPNTGPGTAPGTGPGTGPGTMPLKE